MQDRKGHLPGLFLTPNASSKHDAHAHAMSTGVLGRWGKDDVDSWMKNKDLMPQDCTPPFLQKNASYASTACWAAMRNKATEIIVTYEDYLRKTKGKAEDECMAKTIIFIAPKEAALEYWFWRDLRNTLMDLYKKRVHKARTGEDAKFVFDTELSTKAEQILQHVVLIDPTVSKPSADNDSNYPQDVIDEWKRQEGYVVVFENMQPTDKLVPDYIQNPIKIMYLYGSEAYTKKPMKAMQDRSYPYAPLVVNLHQDFLTTVQSQTEYNPLAFFQAKLEQDKLAKYSSAYLTVNSYPESISFMQDMVDIIEATIEKGAVQHVNNQGGADSSSESDDSGSDEPPPSWMGSLFGLFDRGERPPEGAGALLSAAEQKAEEDRLAKEDAARVEASNKLKDDVAISDALKAEEESHYQASVELARRLQAEEEGKGRAGPSKSNNNDAEAAASAAEAAQIEAAKSYSIQTENARREKEQREQEAERAKAASSSSKNPQEAAAEAAFARAEAARGPPKLRGISQKHRQRQGNKPVSTKEDRENVNRALEAHAKKQSLKEAEAAAAVKAAEAYQAGSAAEAAEEADAVAAAIMQVEELKAAEAAEAAQAAAAAGPSNAAGPSGAAGTETMDDIIDQLNALTSQLGSLPDDEYKEAAIDSIISEMARLKEKIDNL